jgi:hypothetical protein
MCGPERTRARSANTFLAAGFKQNWRDWIKLRVVLAIAKRALQIQMRVLITAGWYSNAVWIMRTGFEFITKIHVCKINKYSNNRRSCAWPSSLWAILAKSNEATTTTLTHVSSFYLITSKLKFMQKSVALQEIDFCPRRWSKSNDNERREKTKRFCTISSIQYVLSRGWCATCSTQMLSALHSQHIDVQYRSRRPVHREF